MLNFHSWSAGVILTLLLLPSSNATPSLARYRLSRDSKANTSLHDGNSSPDYGQQGHDHSTPGHYSGGQPKRQQDIAVAFLTRVIDNEDFKFLHDNAAKNFEFRVLPASLEGLGQPVRNITEFQAAVHQLTTPVPTINFQPPHEIIVSKDVVVIHVSANGKCKSGVPYTNEYIYIMHFNTQNKITSIKEFLDSKYTNETLTREGGL